MGSLKGNAFNNAYHFALSTFNVELLPPENLRHGAVAYRVQSENEIPSIIIVGHEFDIFSSFFLPLLFFTFSCLSLSLVSRAVRAAHLNPAEAR